MIFMVDSWMEWTLQPSPPLLTSDISARNTKALLCMLLEMTDHSWRSTQEDDRTIMLTFCMACRHLLPCLCQIDHMHPPVLHMLMLLIRLLFSSARDEVRDIQSACKRYFASLQPHSCDAIAQRQANSRGDGVAEGLPRDLLVRSSSSVLKASSSVLLAEYSNVAAALTPLCSKLGTCNCQ